MQNTPVLKRTYCDYSTLKILCQHIFSYFLLFLVTFSLKGCYIKVSKHIFSSAHTTLYFAKNFLFYIICVTQRFDTVFFAPEKELVLLFGVC